MSGAAPLLALGLTLSVLSSGCVRAKPPQAAAAESAAATPEPAPRQPLSHASRTAYLEARVAVERGALADAEAAYRRAVFFDGRAVPPHRELGGLMIDAGRLDEALVVLEWTLQLAPEDPRTMAELGRAHYQRGEMDKARALLLAAGERWQDPELQMLIDALPPAADSPGKETP